MTSREKAQATIRRAHFKAGDPLGSLWDAVSDIYESRGTCATCTYADHPHAREPANSCCTLNYTKSGYWQEVKADDYCSQYDTEDKR